MCRKMETIIQRNKNKVYVRILFTIILMILYNRSLNAQQESEVVLAKSYFKEVDSMCNIDNGKLWGLNLYGPIMLVFPETRTIIANQEDNKKRLIEKNGLFIGKLPDHITIANTSFDWDGQKWTMVMWNAISSDRYSRNQLLIHECWHRVENEIGIIPIMSTNNHLDELQGSVLIKLELRALNKALTSNDQVEKEAAIKDALIFRDYRQCLFASNNENEFERHEGMAEYTGYKLCGLSDKYLSIILSKWLEVGENNDGFVNSFAYLTGPAYGFLLDSINPTWLKQIIAGQNIPGIVKNSLKIQLPKDSINLKFLVEASGNKYHASELFKEETLKFQQQEELKNNYKKKLIENNQLIIQNNNISFSYNPQEKLIAVDNMGVVYKTMTLKGEWGTLEVKNGILRSWDWKFFIVSAPKTFDKNPVIEDDYTLTLNQGWSVIKGKDKKYIIKKK